MTFRPVGRAPASELSIMHPGGGQRDQMPMATRSADHYAVSRSARRKHGRRCLAEISNLEWSGEMTYFVTGATGFIGRHLLEKLLLRKGRIHCLVRKESMPRFEALRERLGADKDRLVTVVGD